MDYRKMGPDDRPTLASLWQRVFGDKADFSTRALDIFAGDGNVYVAAEGNAAPLAMLLAVPCTLERWQGIYLYALATEPDARGAGVMTGLMRHAEADKAAAGAQFAALIPATVPLFEYYRKRGYTTEVVLRHLEHEPEGSRVFIDEPDERPMEAERLLELRAKFLGVPCVAFSAQRMELVAADLREDGTWLGIIGEGYAVCRREGSTLLVPELAAENDADAKALLSTLLHTSGCSKAKVTLPAGGGLLAQHSKVHPAALIKPLDDAFTVNAPYLRFALDDIPSSFTLWDG